MRQRKGLQQGKDLTTSPDALIKHHRVHKSKVIQLRRIGFIAFLYILTD
jgi:hypothetical protein